MRTIPPLLATLTLSLALSACSGGDDEGGSFESGGDKISVAGEVSTVAAENGAVWVGQGVDGKIARINVDVKTAEPPIAAVAPGNLISELEIGGGAIWVPDTEEEQLVRVDQADPTKIEAVPIGHAVNDIAYSDLGIWTAGGGEATRVDPRTKQPDDTIETPALSEEIAIEADTVWLPGTTDDGYVERIDAGTGQVNNQPLTIGTQPDAVDSHGGFVWIGDEKEEVLRKIDAKTGQVVGQPIRLDAFPSQVEAGPAGVFVLSESDRITRVNPANGEIIGTRKIAGDVKDIAVDGPSLYIAEGRSGLTRVELGSPS